MKAIKITEENNGKEVRAICVNYEQFITDCKEMTMTRYHRFKCSPQNQFDKKMNVVMTEAFYENTFLPSLFFIRLNKKQSICNCQIDYTFELLDTAFLKTDSIRKKEIDEATLKSCLAPEIDYVMIYVGMNR